MTRRRHFGRFDHQIHRRPSLAALQILHVPRRDPQHVRAVRHFKFLRLPPLTSPACERLVVLGIATFPCHSATKYTIPRRPVTELPVRIFQGPEDGLFSVSSRSRPYSKLLYKPLRFFVFSD